MQLLRRYYLAMLAGAFGLSATPARPNLSGRWKMDLQRSEMGHEMRAGSYYEELIIDHREPLVRIDYRLHFDGKFSEALYRLRTDGSEVRTETPVGLESSRTRWEGEKLVTVANLLGSGTDEQRIVRFLSEGGKQLNVQYGKSEYPKTLIFVPF